MNSLFSTTTSGNTFDTTVNSTTYAQYNDSYKDTKYGLTENIFEPEFNADVTQDQQIDYHNEYNKQITVNPQKDDITTKPQNMADMKVANKWNPIFQKDSELLREQKVGRGPEENTGHYVGTIGANPEMDFVMQRAAQNQQAANRDALKAIMNRNQFVPKGIDKEKWRQEDPEYALVKQGHDLKLQQQNNLYTWNAMQEQAGSVNDIKKRPLVNVNMMSQSHQQKIGLPKGAMTHINTIRHNQGVPQLQRNVFQSSGSQDQIRMVRAEHFINRKIPQDVFLRARMNQFNGIDLTKNPRGSAQLQTMIHRGENYTRPNTQIYINPRAKIHQTSGSYQQVIPQDKFLRYQSPQNGTVMSGAPQTAQQLQYLQASTDQNFRRLAQMSNYASKYGAVQSRQNNIWSIGGDQKEFNIGEIGI